MGKAESDIAVKRHAVNFMYDAPPGFEKKKEGEDGKLELDPKVVQQLPEHATTRPGRWQLESLRVLSVAAQEREESLLKKYLPCTEVVEGMLNIATIFFDFSFCN